MSLFYFDDNIRKHEKELDYSPIITYLEDLYLSEKEVQYLTTLVAYARHFYEGGDDDDLDPVNYDADFLFSKWKHYFELGMKEHIDSPEFCFVAGYVYYKGQFIYETPYDEKRASYLMKRCFELSKNKSMKALAKHYIEVFCPEYRFHGMENAEEICEELFPSDSVLDEDFREYLIEDYVKVPRKKTATMKKKEKKRKATLDKNDRRIIQAYMDLPFPPVYYEMEGLKYIIDLHAMLDGYCYRLLCGASIKNCIHLIEEYASIREEFRYAIDRTDGKDRDKIMIHCHFYNVVRLILKKYRDMYAELGIL